MYSTIHTTLIRYVLWYLQPMLYPPIHSRIELWRDASGSQSASASLPLWLSEINYTYY